MYLVTNGNAKEILMETQRDMLKNDFTPYIETLKSLGIIVGSLGSIAALFFWIGNVIVIARLRAYNLYGLVHYTDEYVTEAGYQFFQDIFTFFHDWKLILCFVVVLILIIITIPYGPFGSKEKEDVSISPEKKKKGDVEVKKKGNILNNLISIKTNNPIHWVRSHSLHYVFFLLLPLSASIILTMDWPVKNLSKNIISQERLLNDIYNKNEEEMLIFNRSSEAKINANEFQKRFYDLLTYPGEIPYEWLKDFLELDQGDSFTSKVNEFQKEFSIDEPFDGDIAKFKESKTYQTLMKIYLNYKLNKMILEGVEETINKIHRLLSVHLKAEDDYSSLVIIPGNYEVVNNSINKLKLLRENILAFFEPGNNATREVMDGLGKLDSIRFGHFLLSYSFWILIGAIVYLLINSARILNFSYWEKGYFIVMVLLFLTILIALPTAYGKYKFEFKIQKLNDVVFSMDAKEGSPIEKKLNDLLNKKTKLYILGPTRGKEIIIGVMRDFDNSNNMPNSQIIILEQNAFKYVNVEPVKLEDIPDIIKVLRESQLAP